MRLSTCLYLCPFGRSRKVSGNRRYDLRPSTVANSEHRAVEMAEQSDTPDHRSSVGNRQSGPGLSGFGFASDKDYALARDVLVKSGHTEEQLVDLFGGGVSSPRSPLQTAALLRHVRGGSSQETLARLFLLGVPTDVERVVDAIKPMELEKWTEAGLLTPKNGMISAKVRILPFRGLLLATEIPAPWPAAPSTLVMGITDSTLSLANFTVRRDQGSVLDLGTGCGIHALLAAKHSQRVLATDINSRAVSLSQLNVKLNDLSNIDVREGDLFEPVGGERFDLILCNPPYVISPESRLIYRDSGVSVDRFAEKTVTQAASFLAEGGFMQMILDWAHLRDQQWHERLTKWVKGNGCDVWIVNRKTTAPEDYAKAWIDEGTSPDVLADRYDSWMVYYRRHGIEAISSGFVFMRRRSNGRNWLRIDEWPEPVTEPVGDDVLAGFGAQDFLEALADDNAFMQARLRVSPRARLVQLCEPSEGGWRVGSARLLRVGGWSCSGPADLPVAQLLGQCDGKRPLGDLLCDVAGGRKADSEMTPSRYLQVARALVARGVLLPVGRDGRDG